MVLSPTCGPWSQMQEINCKKPADRDRLTATRREHHDTHLTFVREIYDEQVAGGRHAHAEQPAYARSWRTANMSAMGGHYVVFD